MITAFFMQVTTLILAADITFIVVGAVTMIYNYGIFNVKGMSMLNEDHPNFAAHNMGGERQHGQNADGALESVLPSEELLR